MGRSNVSAATSPRDGRSRLLSLLTLRRTRAVVRSRRGRLAVASIALAYGFIALLAGYMLEFVRTGSSGTTVEVLTNSYSPAWWNYPALLVVAPGGVLVLPFLATVAMVLVSIGVGLGMGAGLILAVRFFRSWKLARTGSGSATSLAGLTPAMVALLTLGACCSTSAAAAGGIGAIAEVSGTSYDQILLNSWFLNVFQVSILAIALVAQEQLITVYGSLLGTSSEATPTASENAANAPRPVRAPVVALRLFLVIGGTLWTLSLLIEVAAPSTAAPVAGLVVGGLLQHGLLGVTAVAAGLLPAILVGVFSQRNRTGFARAYRALLLVCGASVAVGVPPPLNGWGVYGLGNEILGAAGAPAGLGGVVPPGGSGIAIDLSIAALYALLGIFAMLLALSPGRLLRRLAGWGKGAVQFPMEASQPSRDTGPNASEFGGKAMEDPL